MKSILFACWKYIWKTKSMVLFFVVCARPSASPCVWLMAWKSFVSKNFCWSFEALPDFLFEHLVTSFIQRKDNSSLEKQNGSPNSSLLSSVVVGETHITSVKWWEKKEDLRLHSSGCRLSLLLLWRCSHRGPPTKAEPDVFYRVRRYFEMFRQISEKQVAICSFYFFVTGYLLSGLE